MVSGVLLGVLASFLMMWFFKTIKPADPIVDVSVPDDTPVQIKTVSQPVPVYLFPNLNCAREVLKTRKDIVFNADLAIDWVYRGQLIEACWKSIESERDKFRQFNKKLKPLDGAEGLP